MVIVRPGVMTDVPRVGRMVSTTSPSCVLLNTRPVVVLSSHLYLHVLPAPSPSSKKHASPAKSPVKPRRKGKRMLREVEEYEPSKDGDDTDEQSSQQDVSKPYHANSNRYNSLRLMVCVVGV